MSSVGSSMSHTMASTSAAGSSAGPETDTSLWLHNKLGTSNDSWTGGSIVSQLNPEILSKISYCFPSLQPQVKLKLLLSLLHIPRRNLEAWRSKLESILEVASEDSEPWVCMMSELIKTYPSSGLLNNDIHVPESNRKIFNDLLSDLKKVLKKSDHKDGVLPIEYHFLNKNAFISVVGHTTQSEKHFKLKRKPKAAALRAELINKSQEAVNKLKSVSSGSFPIRKNTMPRKISSEGAPLKGIQNRNIISGFRNQRPNINRPTRKSEGGVKLLDINEQPIGFNNPKKRKRQQEAEEQSTKRSDNQPTSVNNNNANKNINNINNHNESVASDDKTDLNESASKSVPDYTASLSTLNPPTPAAPPPAYAPPTPAYAPPQINPLTQTTTLSSQSIISQLPQQPSPLTKPPASVILAVQQPTTNVAVALPNSEIRPQITSAQFPAGLGSLEPLPQSLVKGVSTNSAPTYNQVVPKQHPPATRIVLPTQPVRFTQPPIPSILNTAIQQQEQRQLQQQPQQQQPQPQQQSPIVSNLHTSNIKSFLGTLTPNPPTQTVVQQTIQQQPQKRSLTLTREQAFEAQEMFRTANKVTRTEKALILGFMAGSRENPCPKLGSLVTIKLSEDKENVIQKDGTYLTMIVETHFQMNYSSGEWRRIKKYRKIEDGQNI